MNAPTYIVEIDRGAEDDLRSLHAYVTATRSREQADILLRELLERVTSLEHYPMRGSNPLELAALGNTEFRQIHLPPYRLIYYVVAAKVIVAVIADGRRNMAALLARRLLRH